MGRRETKVPPRPVNGGAAARYRPERGTDTHLPAVRPAPRRLASAPIRVLRGGSILITTKFPTRPPPPATWRARSALRGGVEPFERPGGRGAPSWGPGTARRSAPVRSVGPRRSSGPGGTLGVERLGGQRPTRSVRYPPARWRGGSVRPLPARYRREKRNETKEKAERAGLALHTPAPRRRGPWPPASCDPALFTWARRWRGSGARSGRGGVTRGPRAAAERGGRGEPVRAGGDAPAPRYMREHWRGGGVRKTRRASGTCTSHGYCPPGRRVLGSGALAGPHVFAPSRSREGTGGARRAGVPTYLHVLSTGRRGGGGRGSLRGPRPPRPRAQPRRAGAGPAGRSPGKRPPPAQP